MIKEISRSSGEWILRAKNAFEVDFTLLGSLAIVEEHEM